MATINVQNGFPELGQNTSGVILTGILVSGALNDGDILVIDNETKVSIAKVEIDDNLFPGLRHIRLFVPEENKVVWHKLYGNAYETEVPIRSD